MRISRFYFPSPYSIGQPLLLSNEVSHHMLRVLRMKVGDVCHLFDGSGNEVAVRLESIESKQVSVNCLKKVENQAESSLSLHLFQALCKGDKMDWILQKAVELGVTAITPVMTERTDVKLDEKRLAKKVQHWQGVIVSACEQSGRAVVPVLHSVCTLAQCQFEQAWVLDPYAAASFKSLSPVSQAALFVGPEGGFTDREVVMLTQRGAQAVQCGPRILRTETAGLAALAAMQLMWA